ncbi:hypothetical protein CG740_15615 [Streptomyces sp. CB01201]|uniref:hypothetical protein n=1 Tax=Streptomyces sp. CB01201 TaxID=2020324 RepID=UPI000C27EAB7|nr:hypothetical protein [Streptomyces sp. CB01201]PJN02462.1 hypothetical protein CG740_15615 [Streptomyces sp. CB01201]
MPQHTPAQNRPVCRHCDGFATVTITTGTRNPDGSRTTIPANCPTCKGIGHTTPAATLARTGR